MHADIRAHLRGRAKETEIHYVKVVDSTNTLCKMWAEASYPEGTVVLAEEQTAGRGRLGRSFYSPAQSGLYCSILLRPRTKPEEALFLTTAAAVAASRAIQQVTGKEVQIKWVNDLYYHDRKVCGILTEAAMDWEKQSLRYAILGIGLNLQTPAKGFPSELSEIAGALYAPEEDVPESQKLNLVAEFLNEFFSLYEKLEERSFLEEYRQRSFLTGKRVILSCGNRLEEGIVEDIDAEARLLVRLTNGTVEAYSAGEVQLQKPYR